MHHQPNGPAFDVVLIAHVACVVVSLVTLVTSAATASRLRTLLHRDTPLSESVVRYFRPGVNWAGRTLYGIPLFGVILLALSHGSYSLRLGWVVAGLIIVVVVVLIAEGSLWPAERRLQVALSGAGKTEPNGSVPHDARVMMATATLALVLLVLGSVLMVAQP